MLRRRADGYHDIETLFLALPWGDQVSLVFDGGRGIRLCLEGAVGGVPPGRDNLAVRAAEAYLGAARRAGRRVGHGMQITVRKRIPPGAGLGGGSSDAAAVLRLLDARLGVLPRPALLGVAASLGADVAFFVLDCAAAVGRGRGDELVPVPVGFPGPVLLVLPGTHHETARVYAYAGTGLGTAPPGGLEAAIRALESGQPRRLRAAHHNALALAARRAYPPFAATFAEIERRLGFPPCVTGTGSALYVWPDPGREGETTRHLAGAGARVVQVGAG